jgi:hypothetical protein
MLLVNGNKLLISIVNVIIQLEQMKHSQELWNTETLSNLNFDLEMLFN